MLESELFALLEGTADAAFAITMDGEIIAWNCAAERLFGYRSQETLHKSCYEILDGVGALGTRVCHENSSVLDCTGNSEAIPNFDLNVKTSSGERLWVNVSTLHFHNARTGRKLLIHLARDITERKHSEELLHQMLELTRQLNQVGDPATRPAPIPQLSEQEVRVLRLFSEGRNSPEVAGQLGISLQTLRNHLHHINQKLRTHNRLQAVMNATRRKLI